MLRIDRCKNLNVYRRTIRSPTCKQDSLEILNGNIFSISFIYLLNGGDQDKIISIIYSKRYSPLCSSSYNYQILGLQQNVYTTQITPVSPKMTECYFQLQSDSCVAGVESITSKSRRCTGTSGTSVARRTSSSVLTARRRRAKSTT